MVLDPPAPRRRFLTPALVVTVLLWGASFAALLVLHRPTAFFSLAVVGYSVYLCMVAAWLLPRTPSPPGDDVLRASPTGGRLVARWAVVVVAVAFVSVYGAAYAGLATGLDVPLLTPLVLTLRDAHLWPGVGGLELFNFAAYALVPGLLLLALGARPHELGLCLPARGTILATLICMVPASAFLAWGIADGRLSFAGLGLLVIHNLLSNGFSEEFQCRGMVLSHLRAVVPTDWALLIQALVFALLHFHPTGAEELADPLRSVAEDVALNLPIGLAFGYLAVRSRSLVLPTLLHCLEWVP